MHQTYRYLIFVNKIWNIKNIVFVTLILITISACTQKKNSNNENMENNTSTLRFIYPQWQGGGTIADFVTEIPAKDAYKGYYLGSQILKMLAPESNQKTIEVSVSLDINDRKEENGVISYQAILKQSKVALDLLRDNNPERIVTLGGECSVSVVPFTYLMSKYPDDVAIVWIDAHPDLNLPGEGHKGYHAMALSACLGLGNESITSLLPAKTDASKALLIGLRAWELVGGTEERAKQMGVKYLAPEVTRENSNAVLEWIKSTGASKVVIHFDLDVIDPLEMIAAVGTDPDGMKIDEVVRVINDIASEFDLVGLTIAEPMPRTAIKIRNMLNKLPLLK